MNINNIRSIGWLNCADDTINLTPCFDGNSLTTVVNISQSEFNELGGDLALMKQKAIDVLNQKPSNETSLNKAIEEYVKKGGGSCFKCSSEDITGGSIDVHKGGATQKVSCNDCDAEWHDNYTLTGVTPSLPNS